MATLVTGVSSGIGRAIAGRLVAEGREVVGVSRRDPELPGLEWIPADLTDADDLASLLTSLVTRRLDSLVHAAGVQFSAPVGELDHEDGAWMWRLHVDVPSRLVDALAPTLPEGARIVVIGSRTATGVAGKSQYSATKAALVGLTRSWAMELAPRRITVNVVAPGPTDTAMLADPNRAATPPKVPALGRFVQPSEVAGMTAFLLGPDGGSVTGQHLVICGGASL
ncbi:SDR family NAD(P)-dependent oxidoreductase [Kineosporia succinea]|uniref:NAD(P)-dependent dehydrogenase (Short-subunit alcohol dehydrogenase family) n=1 Tax=Kineosporia succinea TaxID=84632 RepID=A0ABT9PA90_9ACTN|nr:SDR family oxidoreductase [Kineosporia succinea]MDP9828950.1 NAD(P)-dependent dehydrogenase (short-subunit alcohol dehydrogenase family) [Kineosporia succinea]